MSLPQSTSRLLTPEILQGTVVRSSPLVFRQQCCFLFSLRSRKNLDGPIDRELTLELDRERHRLWRVKASSNRRAHSVARRVVLQ